MREMILLTFLKKEFFRIKTMHLKQKQKNRRRIRRKRIRKIKDNYKNFIKYIEDESKGISYELFKKYFYSSVPSVWVKILYKAKNKKDNNELVNVIKSGLIDLQILTPDQMLSRLPITLSQLKAGNNSEKFKNEIRQLLYSLYRSKKLTKQLYKSLTDII